MPNSRVHVEPERHVPLVEEVDVLVAGGGPAGICAAIAAAREGAKVQLIEVHGCLGGVWTAGLLSWILDAKTTPGLMMEIVERLDRRGAVRHARPGGGIAYDNEQTKRLLEEMAVEAGVSVRLHTRLVAASRDSHNRAAVAITESKSGREAWAAKVFIDCTGDGDLAAQLGCGFDFGRPATGVGSLGSERAGETQPMTLMCLITGIDPVATSEFHERTGRPWHAPKDALMAEFRRAGAEPSYGKPTIFEIHSDLYAWMINHEYNAGSLDAQQITQATLHARDELHRNIDALRGLGGIWENIRIVATADQIGIREGRRIHGRYTVTADDLVAGQRHPDAVCRVNFGIDVHSTSKNASTGIEAAPIRSQPYDIPLRALIARDVDSLLLAGRCISGDFLSHSSYRVTGNSAALGEAAGVCAALASKMGVPPHEVEWEQIDAALRARRESHLVT